MAGVPAGDTTLLARLRELDQQATPGPWGINAGYECYGIQSQAPGEPIVSPTWDTRMEDARFICELRNALPAVVTLIEAAQDAAKCISDENRHTQQAGIALDAALAVLPR